MALSNDLVERAKTRDGEHAHGAERKIKYNLMSIEIVLVKLEVAVVRSEHNINGRHALRSIRHYFTAPVPNYARNTPVISAPEVQ